MSFCKDSYFVRYNEYYDAGGAMRTLLMIVGFLIGLCSSFFVIAAIADLIQGSETETGILIGLLVFFGGTMFGGFYLLYSQFKKKKGAEIAAQEETILRLVTNRGGRITPMELARDTSFSIDQSKSVLDEYCDRGYCQLEVTDKGNLLYVFEGFLSPEEKSSSKDILD